MPVGGKGCTMIYRGRNSGTDTSPPMRNNTSTSGQAFYYHEVYEGALPFGRPFFADHHGTVRCLYGKVDTDGYVIRPKSRFLKEVDQKPPSEMEEDSETHLALPIVADCFREFKRFYNRLRERNKLNPGGILREINVNSSWHSSEEEYSLSMFEKSSKFNKANLKNKNILKYEDYENLFVKSIEGDISSCRAATMSENIVNDSALSTGLFLELSDHPYDIDFLKFEHFISDPNFDAYRKSLKRFGFKIDKNIPWRIFIDFSSPYIVEKMRTAGFSSLSEFFAFYYDRVCVHETEVFFRTVRTGWDRFIRESPSFSRFSSCGTELVDRMPETPADFDRKKYLKMYIHFRARELGKNWSQSKINSIIAGTLVVYKNRGIETALLRAETMFRNRTNLARIKKSLTHAGNSGTVVNRATRSSTFDYASSTPGSGGSTSGY